MAFKMTVRGATPAIVRRHYRCTDCKHEFSYVHVTSGDPAPDCPMCLVQAEAKPCLPAKRTDISRAVDYTQSMLETDYGMTNFRDNTQPGEATFMPPPPVQTAEREAIIREMREAMPPGIPVENAGQVENFWQGAIGADSTEQTIGQQSIAAQASAAAVRDGVDGIGILEKARDTGNMTPKFNVVARSAG